MNTQISKNLQKLLIQKGIDIPVKTTVADVVMWLYEKHGIWVSADIGKKFWIFRVRFTDSSVKVNGLQLPDGLESTVTGLIFSNTKHFKFKTPTEAYESAIEYCLNKLI